MSDAPTPAKERVDPQQPQESKTTLIDPERTGAYVSEADTPPQPAVPPGLPAVPGYEILGELGRGGMGVVYKARHLQLKRTVALKMILAGSHAGPEHLARFRSEAEAVARLQHPNIVQIYDIGDHDGLPFFSLEFVDGGSLHHKLACTPQPPRDAAQLLETLARAVHAAHQSGIVHRDLKPANILLQKLTTETQRHRDTEKKDKKDKKKKNLQLPLLPLLCVSVSLWLILFPRSPTSAWPSSSTPIRDRRKRVRSWARRVTWPRSKPPGGPRTSAR